MRSLRPQRHVCHVVSSLEDNALLDVIFANIRLFGLPHYTHTLITLHKGVAIPVNLPSDTSCLELALKGSLVSNIKTCSNALRALKPNICHTYGDDLLPIQWLAKREQVPLKLHHTSNDVDQLTVLQTLRRTLAYRVFQHSVDYVISPENQLREWLIQNTNAIAPKVKTIRVGVNAQAIRPSLKEVSQRVQTRMVNGRLLADDQFVIALHISRLDKHAVIRFLKQFHLACCHSSAFGHKALLLLIGHNQHATDFRRFFERYDINDNQWLFCNQSTQSERYFDVIDAVAILESLEISVLHLETMSMGIPVLTPRHNKQVIDNTNPFKWQPEGEETSLSHQMLSLFSNIHQRIRLGRVSRDYILRRHQQSEHFNQLNQLYHLVNRKPEISSTSVRGQQHTFNR